jgi:restriction system protein
MGGSGKNADILAKVIELEKPAPEVQSLLQNESGNETKLGYNLAWAKTYLRKVGAVTNSEKGVWSLTNDGEKLTAADVALIPGRVQKMLADEKLAKGIGTGGEEQAGETIVPNSIPAAALNPDELDTAWKNQLLTILKQMPPDRFERLASRMLQEAGMTGVRVTPPSGDGGVDGEGMMPMTPLGLLSLSVAFQCKRYDGSVASSAIRDFRGAIEGRADRGIFITTGNFTSDATKEANRPGAKRIDLIDGVKLCEKLRELRLGVKMIETVSVDASWFDDPSK